MKDARSCRIQKVNYLQRNDAYILIIGLTYISIRAYIEACTTETMQQNLHADGDTGSGLVEPERTGTPFRFLLRRPERRSGPFYKFY